MKNEKKFAKINIEQNKMSAEYNGNGQMSNGCGFANLNNYNQGYSMGFNTPVAQNGAYIVPTWGAMSYSALQIPNAGCVGYGNIQTAYGSGAASCQTSYTTSLCNGGMLRQ